MTGTWHWLPPATTRNSVDVDGDTWHVKHVGHWPSWLGGEAIWVGTRYSDRVRTSATSRESLLECIQRIQKNVAD